MDSSEAASPTASPFKPDKITAPAWITLVLLLAACIAARLWCLACKPFWFDEAYSVELSRIDWRNFVHLLWWREANMSLYYILLRIWLHFGQSPGFIRGLSVVFAGATVPAIYWLARMLYDGRVALISAALFAFNAYSVRYAQEARSYTLFLLLAILSSAFLIAWIQRPTRANRIGYIAMSVLATYAHLYALLLIAAQWIALRYGREFDAERKSEARRLWIAIGIGVAPLIIFVAKTGAGPIKWITRPGIREIVTFYEQLAGGHSWSLLAAYAAGCVIAVAPFSRKLLAREQGWEVWRCQFLLIWLLFPVALTVALSLARPVFLPRYMIFTMPALLVLTAAGVARLRTAWILGAVVAALLLLNSSGVLYVYGHDFDTERDASGAASDFILDHARPGDGAIFHIAGTRVAYEFFRSLRAEENTAAPGYKGELGPEIVFPQHGRGMDYRDFTGKPGPELVRDAGAEHRRIWIMLMNNGPAAKPDPTTVMLTQVLSESFSREQSWQFNRVELRLYSRE
jgi:mannosyltransferase